MSEDVANKSTTGNLDQVVAAYEHALFSVHPYCLYDPGSQAKIMMTLKRSIIGLFIMEKIISSRTVTPKILTK